MGLNNSNLKILHPLPAADAVPGTENATRSVFQDIYLNEQDVINKQDVDVNPENNPFENGMSRDYTRNPWMVAIRPRIIGYVYTNNTTWIAVRNETAMM